MVLLSRNSGHRLALTAGLDHARGRAVVANLAAGAEVPGWASLVVAILFPGAVQLVSLGIVGEHVGRISEEAKGRPLYVVDRVLGDGPAAARRGADRTGRGPGRRPSPGTPDIPRVTGPGGRSRRELLLTAGLPWWGQFPCPPVCWLFRSWPPSLAETDTQFMLLLLPS